MRTGSIASLLLFLFGVADGIVLMLAVVFRHNYQLVLFFQFLGWAMAAFGGVWASRLDFRR